MTIRLTLLTLIFALGPSTTMGDPVCKNDRFTIDAHFEGADVDACRFASDNSVVMTFLPEDRQVDSTFSWFSFRVTATEPGELDIRMEFPDTWARFLPKLSIDGEHWVTADSQLVSRSDNGKVMNLDVHVGNTPTWVSAQELLTQRFYDDWLKELGDHTELQIETIGESLEKRPIRLARTVDKPEYVILIGRQHPVEVPGAMAMRAFVDVVLADTELARAFRRRFALIILPLLNPDGVANGHSRHNAGGADLNRDWGPFTQPETSSAARLFEQMTEREMQPTLMLDFHATKETPTMLLYTQMPDELTNPKSFASNWLERVAERTDGFEFAHEPRPPSGLDNTKNFFFSRYGIPAITYEIGDEVNREELIKHTPAFAEEMMRTLLGT